MHLYRLLVTDAAAALGLCMLAIGLGLLVATLLTAMAG